MGGIKKTSVSKNCSIGIEQKFKVMRDKSYRCEKDLRAAESKIPKLAQAKFHYAAEWNFILGKWLLEGNETAPIRFEGQV